MLNDLEQRFGLKRMVFVGDGGMVTSRSPALVREHGHDLGEGTAKRSATAGTQRAVMVLRALASTKSIRRSRQSR